MKNPTEKDVLKGCQARLSAWQSLGKVIKYLRLNSGKVRTEFGTWVQLCEKGTPDLVAFINYENTIWVYWIECKHPDGGDWKFEQQQFNHDFKNFSNVIYELVMNPKQIDTTIEKITGYYQKMLDNLPEDL